MKLLDIIKRVGSRAIREAVPGGGVLIDAVNAVLPAKHRLPPGATGCDVEDAVNSLPPEQRAHVMSKRYDVQMEELKSIQAMLAADERSTQTTRPYIAMQSFHLLALVTVGLIVGILYAVWKTSDPLPHLVDAWPLIVSLLAPFVVVLRAYFGMLTHEHRNRLDCAVGRPTSPAGFLSTLFKRK